MNSREVRIGKYGECEGKLYRILSGDGNSEPETIKLCSSDEHDPENGFTNNYSEYTSKKYGFTYVKDVPKSEITQVCDIRAYVVYKGIKFAVIGGRNGTNLVTLCGNLIRSYNSGEEERKYEEELIKIGFHKGIVDKTFYMYIKEVPIDDPELELFELRQKTDLDKP